MRPCTAGASLHRRQAVRPCTAVPRPCGGGGASLHRLPCAPPARPAPAVEIRKNDLEGVEAYNLRTLRESDTVAVLGSAQPSSSSSSLRPRLEAVKSASNREGGLLGRRDSSHSFVLIHCLFGTLQQFVDPHGTPWIEVCDSHAQRQRGKITAVRWPRAGTQHDRAARGVVRTRRQGGELIAAQPAEHLVDPVAGGQIAHEVARLPD